MPFVSFSSTNLTHPSSSPCGADVSSILTDLKAIHTQKHHLGSCFSCVCLWVCVRARGCVCVLRWRVCTKLPCVFLNLIV